MLIEPHITHVLSHNSSSNNHSYDSDIIPKKMNNIKQNVEKEKSVNSQLTKLQISKINDILGKYNLISSDRNEKKDNLNNYINQKLENGIFPSKSFPKPSKNFFAVNNEVQSTQKKKRKKHFLKKNDMINDNKQMSNNNSILNINNNKIYNNRFLQFPETKSDNNKNKDLIFAISYKQSKRETRFNNIQKFMNEENRIQQKIKNKHKKHKLLIYQEMIKSRNLLRSINKPKISFITKVYKNFGTYYSGYDMFSGVRLNVKNNCCFFTKKIIRQDEYIVIEKQLKLQKYEKLKKEMEEEKIPTFSCIDSSSSNSLKKVKAKGKGKSKTKSKSKKKSILFKTKIKPKNLAKKKKKVLLPKHNRVRPISVNSKISNEKSEDKKTANSRLNNQKILNIKKRSSSNKRDNKKVFESSKDDRKLSMISRFHDRFVNKRKNISSSLKNVSNSNNPFKNSLFNMNKKTEEDINNKINISGNKDKDKTNNELDFKKFIEEQKIKKSIKIRNFIKKQGMNSYNFFYPKEPSPLLGIFKNKYSLYPTLNMDRKNSIDEEEKRLHRLKNEMNYSPINKAIKKGSKSYRREKIFLKEIKENKKEEVQKLHLIEKHYGTEKECPICRAFQLRKEEENEMNYIKTARYNKLKLHEKSTSMLSPNSQSSINIKNDFTLMSRNRISSAKKSDIINENQSSQINKNYNVVFDYFMQ